jgi:hypothetical protein
MYQATEKVSVMKDPSGLADLASVLLDNILDVPDRLLIWKRFPAYIDQTKQFGPVAVAACKHIHGKEGEQQEHRNTNDH